MSLALISFGSEQENKPEEKKEEEKKEEEKKEEEIGRLRIYGLYCRGGKVNCILKRCVTGHVAFRYPYDLEK